MANVIKLKRGSGSDPSASDLVVGEVAIRTDSGKLFTKKDNGTIAEISGSGGGSDIFINTLSSSSGSGGGSAVFDDTATRFTLSNPPAVSAQQLLVSINGVIQKPNSGTSPSEGFAIDGNDIIFAAAPATGSDFFIVTYGSLNIAVPADNSVTSAKIADGAIVNADINASAAIAGSKINPSFGNQAVTSTNSITLDGSVGDTIIKASGAEIEFTRGASSNITCSDSSGSLNINTGGSNTRLKIDSSGNVQIPNDSGKLQLGASQDLQIYHDGSTSYIKDAGTGNLRLATSKGEFRNAADTENLAAFTENGGVELYYDHSKKLEVFTWGVEINGDLGLDDNRKVALGNGPDLEIYHDGTDSRIHNSTGRIVTRTATEAGWYNSNGTEPLAVFKVNEGVKLYYDSSKKFETISSGSQSTGDFIFKDSGGTTRWFFDPTNGRVQFYDNIALSFGNHNDLKLLHDGSSNRIIAANHDLIVQSNGYAIRSENGSSTFVTINSSGIVSRGDLVITANTGSLKLYAQTGYSQCPCIIQNTGNNTAADFIQFKGWNGSIVGSISGFVNSTSYATSSDYRLKENEVAISDGITRLKTLKPYRFNFKTTPLETVDGFFAHEVTPAVPEAVVGEKDGTEMQGIDQSKLVPLLVAALQEAITKIETLETKVAALEAG